MLRKRENLNGTKFQSPPSVRKATRPKPGKCRGGKISIPAFREEGDADRREVAPDLAISIPAFREEGDLKFSIQRPPYNAFQSPPSVRKATSFPAHQSPQVSISIPAFREEGDWGFAATWMP